ncbi:MAG: hypothetical protein P4L99_03005, partial [Chthoniobacter sp.]|nr:hypothetical protein [Chthoniobacter sp.]
PAALRFADLEFGMPSDPILSSSTPNWQEEHTPPADLEYAVMELRAFVPIGLSADEARKRLKAAGCHFTTTDRSTIGCRYNDVQTPDSEYIDSVVWKVSVPLVDGRVTGLKVARDWYRH